MAALGPVMGNMYPVAESRNELPHQSGVRLGVHGQRRPTGAAGKAGVHPPVMSRNRVLAGRFWNHAQYRLSAAERHGDAPIQNHGFPSQRSGESDPATLRNN